MSPGKNEERKKKMTNVVEFQVARNTVEEKRRAAAEADLTAEEAAAFFRMGEITDELADRFAAWKSDSDPDLICWAVLAFAAGIVREHLPREDAHWWIRLATSIDVDDDDDDDDDDDGGEL